MELPLVPRPGTRSKKALKLIRGSITIRTRVIDPRNDNDEVGNGKTLLFHHHHDGAQPPRQRGERHPEFAAFLDELRHRASRRRPNRSRDMNDDDDENDDDEEDEEAAGVDDGASRRRGKHRYPTAKRVKRNLERRRRAAAAVAAAAEAEKRAKERWGTLGKPKTGHRRQTNASQGTRDEGDGWMPSCPPLAFLAGLFVGGGIGGGGGRGRGGYGYDDDDDDDIEDGHGGSKRLLGSGGGGRGSGSIVADQWRSQGLSWRRFIAGTLGYGASSSKGGGEGGASGFCSNSMAAPFCFLVMLLVLTLGVAPLVFPTPPQDTRGMFDSELVMFP